MHYEEFVETFEENLKLNMKYENITITRTEVPRENEVRDAFTVRFGDSMVAPIIYLRDKYDLYEKGMSVDEIAGRTADSLRDAMKDAPEAPALTHEEAEKNLYCAVVCAQTNKELLKQIPHEAIAGDLAVIAKYRLDETSSFIVRNDICSRLQMTPAEIMEQAHQNTERMEFSCRNMNEVLASLMDFPEGMGTPEQVMPECGMYVISNSENFDGAVAITDTDFMEEVRDRFGEDFYILPSSRHEVIVLPDSVAPDVEALRSMVHEVNATQVSVEDRLSDTVYHYDSLTKAVTIAGEVMEKEEVHEKIRTQARAR